jgi:glutathionyl-hydroquinone reductase
LGRAGSCFVYLCNAAGNGAVVNGGFSQQARVLEHAFRPYVSDEAWQSMDEAPDAIRDEFNQWADWLHEEETEQ